MEQGSKQPALSNKDLLRTVAAVPYHFDGGAGLPLGVVNHFEIDAGFSQLGYIDVYLDV